MRRHVAPRVLDVTKDLDKKLEEIMILCIEPTPPEKDAKR